MKRPEVGVSPVLVNQRTAPAILSWPGRRYIRFIRSRGIRHAVDGRLIVARVDDVLAALGLADAAPSPDAAPAWSPEAMRRSLMCGARKAGAS